MLLNISPFVTRELRVALRQPPKISRFVAACIVSGISFLMLVFCFDFSPRKPGTLLYYGLLTLGLAWVTLASERGSYLFADERRNGTLGLLFSTGITPSEVLVGKLAAGLVMPLSWLLTLVPGLILVRLMGGASFSACWSTILVLIVLLALAYSIHLLASLLFEEQSSAKTFADGVLAFLVGAVPLVNWLNSLLSGGRLSDAILALSPGYGPWMLFEDPRRTNLEFVLLSCGYSFLMAACFLTASGWLANRVWKDQAGGGELTNTLRRWYEPLRKRRRQLAKALMESNPYCWLVMRDFSPTFTSWLVIGSLVAVWLAGWWKWSSRWLNPINFWATFLILSGVVRWMMSYIAARQIGRDRSTGTLELLLTSPLSVDEIVSGQKLAMREYARPFFLFMGILLVLLFTTGFLTHPMNLQARFNYVVFWIGVATLGPWFDLKSHWLAFWVSLNTGRPGLALRRQVVQRGAMVSLYVQAFVHRDKLAGIPSGQLGENVFAYILAAGCVLVVFIYRMGWMGKKNVMEDKASEHMRSIAAQPVVEMNDPRLKRWEQDKPLHLMKRPKEIFG